MAKNQVICENVGTLINHFNTTADNSKLPQKRFSFSFGIPNAVTSFCGRQEEVKELDRLFDANKIVAVHGLGGFGKTQLVCHYAELRREKYSGNILWIKGETENLLIKSFSDAALRLEISNCKDLEINHVIQDVYNYFEGTRVLFVIDNAKDYRSILEYLPESSKLKDGEINVLITSQSTKWGNISGLPLQGLSMEDALKVLSTIIGEDKFNIIPKNEWKDLAETFYCIPLDLQIAGGYVRQRLSTSLSNDFSVKRYIARIEEKKLLLDEELAVDSCSSYKKTIYRSLYITVEKIENNDGEESKWALDIINICAHLNPEDITVRLLLKIPVIGGSMDRLEEALSVLEHHSLIVGEHKQYETMIRVHRLVQIFFRYHQRKCQNVTNFYKEALYTVTTDISCWFYAQCVHIIADTNNLKMLLESLKEPEKKMIMKECKLLHVASKAVLLEAMQLLLQHGADVNSSNIVPGCKGTPLCFLMDDIDSFDETKRRRWENAARLLLKHKANLRDRDSNCGKTLLHSAAEWKCAALIGHILDKKQLDINVKDKYSCTALQWVTNGKIWDETEVRRAKECIQVLVSRNADINARDSEGRSVLHYSAMYDNWFLTEFLIDQFGMDSNTRDHEGNTPLLSLCERNCLDTELNVDRAEKTIEVLAKRGALISAQDKYGTGILHMVAKWECIPIVEYLVDMYSLNVNIQDGKKRTPLHILAKMYRKNEAEMEKSKEMAQALVQRGANINATDSRGVSVLSTALSMINLPLVEYLMKEHEVNVNQQDSAGRTPLFWAVDKEIFYASEQDRMEAAINLLISKDANPTIKDTKGRTILHHCALKLNSQLLEFFIGQHGFNPDEQDMNGFTALHFLAKAYIRYAKHDAIRCINILRNLGARVDLVNNENLTPAQLAEHSDNYDLITLLQ